MERQRGITSAETLLRLFLLHIARGYSLRETSVRAEEAGLATISDVGLLKRLRRSEEWLHWLCTRLVAENGVRMPQQRGQGVVRIVDGTIIKEPGKTGSQWRILYSMRLPDLRCDYFDLTATTGAGTGEAPRYATTWTKTRSSTASAGPANRFWAVAQKPRHRRLS